MREWKAARYRSQAKESHFILKYNLLNIYISLETILSNKHYKTSCKVFLDKLAHTGHTADDVCFCPNIRRILRSKYVLKTPPRDKFQPTQIPSMQEKDSLFTTGASAKQSDELLYRLQVKE